MIHTNIFRETNRIFVKGKKAENVQTFIEIFILMSLLSFSACAKKEAPRLTLQDGVLSIGMEIGYPPMEYYESDGKTLTGFDVALGKKIAEKIGLEVRFVDTAWSEIFVGLETDIYDCIMSSVTITDERLMQYKFSRPYVGNALALVTMKNAKNAPQSPQECEGRNVSYQQKTTASLYMEKLREDGMSFGSYPYDKITACFDNLRQGHVDIIATDLLNALDYVTTEGSPFEIVWQGTANEKFGVCLKKENAALTAAINKALDELFADGTIQRISQEFFKMDLVSAVR